VLLHSNLPLVMSSRSVVVMPALMPNRRSIASRTAEALSELPTDSDDVWVWTTEHLYANRPRGPVWDTMCFWTFLVWFERDYAGVSDTHEVQMESSREPAGTSSRPATPQFQ
jgi:hypothetical protein